MGITPTTRLGKIEFYESHVGPWATSAVAIGLQTSAVTALTTLTSAARKAYGDHLAAQDAAKTATQNFYDKVRAMHNGIGAGADMIETIKAFAETTNNPNVYTLAMIPPPATPGVTPPPGTPSDFSVGLLQDGSVKLTWKCSNPAGVGGTNYEVLRKIGGSTTFTYLGQIGKKSFTDVTIPAGSTPATYQVTAFRSTARGEPAQFTVNFGVGGGGGMFIASTSEGVVNGEMKMAA
jgi:hypothetical protein